MPVKRQVQRHLSPAEQVAVVRAYQSGADMATLAKQYGVHRHSVSRALHALGIPLRRGGLRPEDVAEAAQLYEAGWSLARLGDRYSCTHTAVRAKLISHGVKMRPRPGWSY